MADQWTDSPYYTQALQYAGAAGINPQFFVAQIGQESAFNPLAQNGNATGIAQFMPTTATQFGVNPTDPVSSLQGAAQYDAQLLQQCNGDYLCVAQKYGTIPASNTTTAPTAGQLTVINAAMQANLVSGNVSGYTITNTQTGQTLSQAGITCGTFDVACYIKEYGSDLLAIIAGLILVTGGIFLLKPSLAPNVLTKTIA